MRFAVAALLMPWLPIGVGQAAMGKIPLSTLVCQAELIVEGRVDSVLTNRRISDLHGDQNQANQFASPYVAILLVETVVRGRTDARRVQIEFTLTEDSPRYRPGETVIAFLARGAAPDTYETVGLLQGRFVVVNGQVERERLPVGEFLSRIRAQRCTGSRPSR